MSIDQADTVGFVSIARSGEVLLSISDHLPWEQDEEEASVSAEYEAHIAALGRNVGQLTIELDLVKKTPRQPIAGDSGNSSIITGPRPALSDGGAKC